MIVGSYVLRKGMKSKKYRVFLSFTNKLDSTHQEDYNKKLFHLKIEFKDKEMLKEFMRYSEYKTDSKKNFNFIGTMKNVDSRLSHLAPFLWVKYLCICKLDENKIGGIFMMEELK